MKGELDVVEETHFLNACLKIRDTMICLNGYRHWFLLINFVLTLLLISTEPFLQDRSWWIYGFMGLIALFRLNHNMGSLYNPYKNLACSVIKCLYTLFLVVKVMSAVITCRDQNKSTFTFDSDYRKYHYHFPRHSDVCREPAYILLMTTDSILIIMFVFVTIELFCDVIVLLYTIVSRWVYYSPIKTKISTESDKNKETWV